MNTTAPPRYLRRTEPSAALIPRPGQRRLALYRKADHTDVGRRIAEFKAAAGPLVTPLQPTGGAL